MLNLSPMRRIRRSPVARASLLVIAVALASVWSTRPILTFDQGTRKGPPLSTPAELAAFGDDVFVGKVLRISGRDDLGFPFPMTQFTVRVETVIKGQLQGDVTVNQEIGTRLWGLTLRADEDDWMIRPGHRYLLVTRGSIARGRQPHPGSSWHWIAGPAAHPLVDRPAVRQRIIATFRAAVGTDA